MSGPQTTFHNQTHARSDKEITQDHSDLHAPVLYILMQKWTDTATLFVHKFANCLIANKRKKRNFPELPAALYLALSLAVGHRRCMFQSELIHTAGF